MKTAIITGASTGIGRATAVAMAKAGYHVFLVARSQEKLKETAKVILEHGGESTIIVTDLSKLDQVNKLIHSISEKVESIEAIINIAGIWHSSDQVFAGKDFQTFGQRVILDTYTVGFTAPSLIVHGLLSKMASGGKIVNLTGTFENGGKGWVPYFASKRALEDFTLGLAQDLKEKEIQVNAVSPSDTATESYAKFFPEYIKDSIDPEHIAEKIVELCKLENKTTGKVIVMKKDTEPFEHFHY